MKKILFLIFISIQLSAQISATFELDLSQYNGNYSTVEFYRGGQYYLMNNIGPDLFSYTAIVPPFLASNYTYKFSVDGITESFSANEPCVFISALDTNRMINLNTTNPSLVCWESCTSCASSIYGCIDSSAINYDSLANVTNDSCLYNVTFIVDMSEANIYYDTLELNGTFNSWCGNCAQMEDSNNDSVWVITIPLMNGDYEYKFSADNWSIEEDLYELDDCVIGSPPYINRDLVVTGNQILDTVCWNRCYTCTTERNFYNVTFQVDMSNYVGNYSTPEVNGTFNNWCGNCWSLENQGNGIYSKSFNVDTALHYYKFSADNWSIQEELDSALNCVIIQFDSIAPNGWGYVNRFIDFSSDTILAPVCWEDCLGCPLLSWECDGQGNCFDPGNGIGTYSSLSQCESMCYTPTWDCDPQSGCFLLTDGSGTYNDSISCIYDCQILSLDDINKHVSIFPNPSDGFFHVEGLDNIEKITIYDILGSTVYQNTFSNSFDLSNLKPAVYYVSILHKNRVLKTKILKN